MSVGNDSGFVVCWDCRRYVAAIDKAIAENTRLSAINAEMLKALEGVVRVADRKTIEFEAARTAISSAKRGE